MFFNSAIVVAVKEFIEELETTCYQTGLTASINLKLINK